jgi:hypothetical protein
MASGTVLFAAVTLAAGVFLAGCCPQSEQGSSKGAQGTSLCCPVSAASTHDDHAHDDHGHQHAAEGPHGGQLIELGDGQYRAELVHDKAAHTVTVYLLDAEAKGPAASDRTEITLQLFEDGQFGDYTLEAVPGDAGEAGPSQFAIVNEKLSDALLGSDEVRGRLQVSIQGKPLIGIIEHHSHEQSHHDNDDPDHDKGTSLHNG